jgi:hypothetical protein
MDILRSMEIFNYHDFRKQLQEQARSFAPNQKAMMSLRLSLLDSCLKDGSVTNRVASHFRQGQLTIIEYVQQCFICLSGSHAATAYRPRSWTRPPHAPSLRSSSVSSLKHAPALRQSSSVGRPPMSFLLYLTLGPQCLMKRTR